MFYSRLFSAKKLDDSLDSNSVVSSPIINEHNPDHPCHLVESSTDCTLVTSATNKDVRNTMHYPVIDIDVPMNLVPASRLGHTHLYINHPVSFDGMIEIMEVLTKHGIVEKGYLNSAKNKGYAAVRLPWVRKEGVS